MGRQRGSEKCRRAGRCFAPPHQPEFRIAHSLLVTVIMAWWCKKGGGRQPGAVAKGAFGRGDVDSGQTARFTHSHRPERARRGRHGSNPTPAAGWCRSWGTLPSAARGCTAARSRAACTRRPPRAAAGPGQRSSRTTGPVAVAFAGGRAFASVRLCRVLSVRTDVRMCIVLTICARMAERWP